MQIYDIQNIVIDKDKRSMKIPDFILPHSHKTLLEIKKVDIGYTTPLLENLSFAVEKKQRIAIIGSNGIGKSTLLNSLCLKNSILKGEIVLSSTAIWAIFSQDILSQFNKETSLITCLMNCTHMFWGCSVHFQKVIEIHDSKKLVFFLIINQQGIIWTIREHFGNTWHSDMRFNDTVCIFMT